MLSKAKLKFIRELHTKKGRENSGLFIAEGFKLVDELCRSELKVTEVYESANSKTQIQIPKGINVIEVSDAELKKMSSLVSPNATLAIVEIPDFNPDFNSFKNKLVLLLDGIQDPGNLGTIIRIADWFGIETLFCSPDTVDCYNPKVVQATMGSIARVKLFYTKPEDAIQKLLNTNSGFPIYGAVLGGTSIYSTQLSENGLIVIGNESRGISPHIEVLLTDKITIPNFSHLKQRGGEAESLNAAVATAIICAEFRRAKK